VMGYSPTRPRMPSVPKYFLLTSHLIHFKSFLTTENTNCGHIHHASL